MKFVFCASGADQPAIKDFDVQNDKEINEGEAVCLTGEKITGAKKGGTLLGVVAETHSGKTDTLNARAVGNKIRVNITQGAVYAAKAKVLTADSGCTATSFKCTDSYFGTSVNSGKLVLKYKAPTSTNTEKIGSERTVSACAVTSGAVTLTVSSGTAACEGDVYEYYPKIGSEMSLDADGTGFAPVNSATDVKLKTVGIETRKSEVYFMLKNALFA